MTSAQREALLSRWIRPSSDNEKDQQDRAERMVRDAIDAHSVFEGVDRRVYTKGSYPNNTNVRRDSDVDVVVELKECEYYNYAPGVVAPPAPPGGTYEGPWTPASWRAEVGKALDNAFGAGVVDRSGKIAINIPAVAGSRPSADVVPSFVYRRYNDAARTDVDTGSCVFSTAGTKIVNWPDQQLEKGRAKNTRTNSRYKYFVRALKNAENTLVAAGTISALPSYLMECLVFNVPDETLRAGSLDYGFQETLRWLYLRLDDGSAHQHWVEPNWCKWLFRGDQKWTVSEAKTLVLKDLELPRLCKLMGKPAQAVRIAVVGILIAYTAVLYAADVQLDSVIKQLLALLPAVAAALLTAWDLFVWRFPGAHRANKRPRLDGLWRVDLRPTADSHIPPGGNRGPISAFMVVSQTYWTIGVRQLTKESTSDSRAYFWSRRTGAEVEVLSFIYENRPKQEHQPRSAAHLGSCSLEPASRTPTGMIGVYFTDRYTKGDMTLTLVDRTKGYASFEAAEAHTPKPPRKFPLLGRKGNEDA